MKYNSVIPESTVMLVTVRQRNMQQNVLTFADNIYQ